MLFLELVKLGILTPLISWINTQDAFSNPWQDVMPEHEAWPVLEQHVLDGNGRLLQTGRTTQSLSDVQVTWPRFDRVSPEYKTREYRYTDVLGA